MNHSQKFPRLPRVCTLCRTGHLDNEQHLVFKRPALQGERQIQWSIWGSCRYNGSWQNDTYAVPIFIEECTEAHRNHGPQSQASDQNQLVAGYEVKIDLSVSFHLLYIACSDNH